MREFITYYKEDEANGLTELSDCVYNVVRVKEDDIEQEYELDGYIALTGNEEGIEDYKIERNTKIGAQDNVDDYNIIDGNKIPEKYKILIEKYNGNIEEYNEADYSAHLKVAGS